VIAISRDLLQSYTLAKTIVHGLLVLITRSVGVSIPFAWLIPNGARSLSDSRVGLRKRLDNRSVGVL
jgi:hypothetical protein